MRFDVISLFPDMFKSITEYGVSARALVQNCYELCIHNPRDFTYDNYQRVDDRPYGGGAGMLMQAQPLYESLMHIQTQTTQHSKKRVILMGADGQTFKHDIAQIWLADYTQITLICGRYEGVDQRFIDAYVDEVVSIADIVLSGGELAAMLIMDSMIRLLPNVLGNENSAQQDSFMHSLLDYPHYTRPEVWQDIAVPDVLLSGNHAHIDVWRKQQALKHTWNKRPDLIQKARAQGLLTQKDEIYLKSIL
jgi:tRNA (guanine37-N1)-methyltransferase